MPQRLLYAVLFLLTVSFAAGQSTDCLTFPTIPDNTLYDGDPGDLINTEAGSNTYLASFTAVNGQESFGQAFFTTLGGEQNINLEFASLAFDFPGTYAESFCLEVNATLDGAYLSLAGTGGYFSNLSAAAEFDWPNGIEVFVTGATDEQAICISGILDELVIGFELADISNICYNLADGACAFQNVVVEQTACAEIPGGLFIYFEPLNWSNDFYDLYLNDEFVGFYVVDQVPHVIDDAFTYVGNDDLLIVTICENDNPECCFTVDLPWQTCSENCGTIDYNIETVECLDDGSFYIRFNEFTSSVPNAVYALNNITTAESYTIIPGTTIVMGPYDYPEGSGINFTIEGSLDDCVWEFVHYVDCEPNDCGLYFSEVTQLDCGGSGISNLWIDFVFSNEGGDVYNYYFDGQFIDDFTLPTTPLTFIDVEQYVIGDELTVQVCSDALPECCAEITIPWLSCTSECFSLDLAPGAQYGADADTPPGSVFYQDGPLVMNIEQWERPGLSYPYGNVFFSDIYSSPDSFALATDQYLALDTAWVTIDISAYAETVHEITFDIFDRATHFGEGQAQWEIHDGNSGNFISFTGVPAPGANADFGTLGAGQFYNITPHPTIPGLASVELTGFGNIVHMAATDLYIDNLCLLTQVETTCPLEGVALYQQPCNDDEAYEILIAVDESLITDTTQLEVRIDGQVYDTLVVTDYPFLIGPFDNFNPQTIDIQDVSQADPEDCSVSITFSPVSCGEYCDLISASLTELVCLPSGNVLALFNFNFWQPDNTYTLLVNGEEYFTESYGDGTLEVELNGDPESFTFQFIDNLSGCVNEVFTDNFCFESCSFGNLELSVTDCVDNFYVLTIEFAGNQPQYEYRIEIQPSGQVVEVPGDVFPDGEFSLGIPSFGTNGAEVLDVTVEILNADCPVLEGEIAINCGPLDCSFANVFAEAYECDGDNFLIDFEFDSPNADGTFLAFINGELFGPFAYGELFYTVGPIATGAGSYGITLIDSADPSCFGFYELPAPACSEECAITELVAEVSDCNNESEFFVTLEWNAVNTGDNFILVGNGNNYGIFAYAEGTVTVGPLAADGTTEYEFVMIDLNDPTCQAAIDIGTQACFECLLESLTYEVDCGDGLTLEGVLHVDVVHDMPDDLGFQLYIGTTLIDEFAFGQLPLSLELSYLLLSEGETLRLVIADEDCVLEVPFGLPCCHLEWGDAWVSVGDCTDGGAYFAELSLPNPPINGSDSVVITYGPSGGGGVQTITLAYADFPTQVGPLPGNGETAIAFLAADQLQECTAFAELSAVLCEDVGCIEFEGLTSVFYGPITGYDDGDVIDVENEVVITYEDHPESDCACYVFGFAAAGVPEFIAGSGLTASTDESGIGLDFSAYDSIGTLTLDYYSMGASITVVVNGVSIELDSFEPDTTLSNGASISYTEYFLPEGTTGTITLTGDIDQVELYSLGTAVFDNVCFGNATPVLPTTECLDFPELVEQGPGEIILGEWGLESGSIIYTEDEVRLRVENLESEGTEYMGEVIFFPESVCNIGGPTLAVNRNLHFDFGQLGAVEQFSVTVNFFEFISVRVDNGEVIQVTDLGDLPTQISPNTTLTVLYDPADDSTLGTLVFEGLMEHVTLGSNDMCLADLCWTVPEDDVWPGDVNVNNIADLYDLLDIGVAFAEIGPARNNGSTEWTEQTALDWENSFLSGINYKHADADGNGIVDEGDVAVLEQNYLLSHGPVSDFQAPPATDVDPPVFLDLSGIGEPQAGSLVEIPIVIGTVDSPVEDIYGVAFRLQFDDEAFDASSLELVIPTSWLGEPAVNMLHIDRYLPEQDQWDIALVRNDHNNVSGYGPVAYLRGIIDDIAGVTAPSVQLNIDAIAAIERQGFPLPLRPVSNSFLITDIADTPDSELRLSPNPTAGWLYLEGPDERVPAQVNVYAADSRFLGHYPIQHRQIDLRDLPSGVYFLEFAYADVLRNVQRVVITR